MDIKLLKAQLDSITDEYLAMTSRSIHRDMSDLPKYERQSLVTRAIAAVHRISGKQSSYSREIERILNTIPALHLHTSSIIGIATGLRDDLEKGYIQSLVEVLHAEIFSDFIEMAKHLASKGFKDSAAVIAGSTLESHLKKLALKNSIPIEVDDRPVKAEKLNTDLTKLNVYGLLDQKNVTSWLDLRNKAAHGNYNEYNLDQVNLLIASIQNFVARIPA